MLFDVNVKQWGVRAFFFLFLLTSLYSPSNAIADTSPIPPFIHYGVEDGLSQITVHDFVEDKQGFIWLGTQRGIDRFDGHQFTQVIKGEAPSGLPGSSVYALELDPKSGLIWTATIGGLALFDPISFQVTHIPLIDHGGYRHQSARSLFFDATGQLWVGTENSLFVYNADTSRFIPAPGFSARLKNINHITQDASGLYWLATGDGLYIYDTESVTAVLASEISTELNSLLYDEKGFLWVASSGLGLLKLDISDTADIQINKTYTPESSNIDSIVFDIIPRPDGSIWVASFEHLIAINEEKDREILDYTAGLTRDISQSKARVYSLFENSQGVVFIGTWDSGFFSHDPNSIKFKRLDYSSDVNTFSVSVGPEQSLLLTNSEGLWIRSEDNGIEGPYDITQSFSQLKSKGHISRVLYDDKRDMSWVAGRFGLGQFNQNTKAFSLTQHTNRQGYSLLLTDNHNTLWFGTYNNGLYKLNADTLSEINHWQMPLVINLFQFNQDELWAATLGGLYRVLLDSDTVQLFEHEFNNDKSISHSVVTNVHPLSENEYLVTTQAGGVNLMTVSGKTAGDVSFKRVYRDSVLNSLSIGGVVTDDSDNLWLSTTQGIVQLNPKSGETTEYNSKNGAFNSGYYIGSTAQDAQGKVYFTGVEGTTVFHPNEIKVSDYQPEVYFTSLSVMSEPYTAYPFPSTGNSAQPDGVQINLPHDTLFISADFVSIDYANPKSNQYAYRLLGLNDTWQALPSQQYSLTLTNLNPGHYTLEVKATNIDGVWSDKVARLNINILPPWWQTPVAIFIFGIAFLVALYTIFRWRISIVEARSQNLSKLVEERTQELERAIEKLTKLSATDPLTGLLNRRAFNERATREFTRFKRGGKAFCLLLIDIDYFKSINDQYGHDIGDSVLVQFSENMAKRSRPHDIIARWGGEEFLVLLPDSDQADGIAAAKEISNSVPHVIVNGLQKTLGLTIGIAEISDAHDSIEACIKEADQRLYTGKENGRGLIVGSRGIQ